MSTFASSSLPPPISGELNRLVALIAHTRDEVLAFAEFRTSADLAVASRALRGALTVPVEDVTLSPQVADPIAVLDDRRFQVPRRCVFFYDVEAALPDFLGYVNLQRDRLVETRHALVFWVREETLRAIARGAPDFWAWRNGVFDFRQETSLTPATPPAVEGHPRSAGTASGRDLLERGRAAFAAGRWAEALALAERTLQAGVAEGDESLIADAERLSGDAHRRLLSLPAADRAYNSAAGRYARLGQQRELAETYRALAKTAEQRHDYPSARTWHSMASSVWGMLGDEAELQEEYAEQLVLETKQRSAGTNGSTRATLLAQGFGRGVVRIDGSDQNVLEVGATNREGELLFLLLQRQSVARSELLAALWPEDPPQSADKLLDEAIYRLRRITSSGVVTVSGERCALDRAYLLWYDVDEFEQALDGAASPDASVRASELRRALDLYRAPFLEECAAEWCMPERDRLRRRYLAAAAASAPS